MLFTYWYDSTHYACGSYHYLQVPMTAPGPTLHDTAAYGAAQKVRGNVTDKALPRGQICGLVNSR